MTSHRGSQTAPAYKSRDAVGKNCRPSAIDLTGPKDVDPKIWHFTDWWISAKLKKIHVDRKDIPEFGPLSACPVPPKFDGVSLGLGNRKAQVSYISNRRLALATVCCLI